MKVKSLINVSSIATVVLLLHSTAGLSHDELGVRPHHINLPANPTAVMRAFSVGKLGDELSVQNLVSLPSADCSDGFAGVYPCKNVDLMAFMPIADLVIGQAQSNDEANDIWGWTDPATGSEYAIIGRTFGTSFVDISDAANPVLIGELDTHGRFGSPWRDIKVYNNHAFIVSEASRHGMQVFDLRQLATDSSSPVQFEETAHYRGFGSAHNIVINEESGFAYGVGTDKCSGGLEMVNIQDPVNPTDAGCFASDGYTHDAQCVIYTGPDLYYQGKEICMASNEDTLTVVDVTDKANPVQISSTSYTGMAYTHQGWFTEDQAYFLLDDELDEQTLGGNTRTRVFDASDLDSPRLIGLYNSSTQAIDHNQYVKGNYSYQSNYRAGLRVLDLSKVASGELSEAAYFDIYPADDQAQFNGAWSNYPYFESGNVIVSGIEQGLFVLRPNLGPVDDAPVVTDLTPVEDATVSGTSVNVSASAIDDVAVVGVEFFIDGTSIGTVDTTPYEVSWDSTTVEDGSYLVTAVATDSIGQTGTATNTFTVDNVPDSTTTAHIGDLDSSAVAGGRGGKWGATITVTVHDEIDSVLSGAVVTGSWSNGATGADSCTTDVNGQCNLQKTGIKRNISSVTFSVTNVTHASHSYDSAINHDTDGDSDGTVIVVAQP